MGQEVHDRAARNAWRTGRSRVCRLDRSDQRGSVGRFLAVLIVLIVLISAAGGVALYTGWRPDVGGPRTHGADHRQGGHHLGPTHPGTGLSLDVGQPAPPVLRAIARSPAVSSAALREAIGRLLNSPALGKHAALAVTTLGSTAAPLTISRPRAMASITPASTTKLFTTAAALELLGPQHRFTTKVVLDPRRHLLVLVGGGDPLLTTTAQSGAAFTSYPRPATLQQLASRTAKALHRQGISGINLGYDASLFAGPAASPHWPASDVVDGVVSPVSALWVDEGRADPGLAARSTDPALTATARFGNLLRRRGIVIRGLSGPSHAAKRSPEIAQVSSAPLEAVVEHILEVSDNDGAEVLLRQVAVAAGRQGSFDAGVAVVRHTMTQLGVDMSGARFFDGSGLSHADLVPVAALVGVLQVTASDHHGELRAVLTSLPVAGFTGSLIGRFTYDAPAGLGVVRAKTGTLTNVHALAGVTITRRGTVLLFAVGADRVPEARGLVARTQLDRITTALATCRC